MCALKSWALIAVALVAVLPTFETANILVVFPFPGPSQYILVQPYLKALAARGHNLTVISGFPQKQPIENFHDITIENLHDDYDGLAGLRLIKVSIPAYKLRGESAMLECQYELDGPYGSGTNSRTVPRNRYNHNIGGIGGNNDNDMNYAEPDSVDDDMPVYRHTRTYTYQQQREQQQQQLQRLHRQQRDQPEQQQKLQYYRPHQYPYQPQQPDSNAAYYQEQQNQQQQHNSYESQQPYEYQYQTQKSPYGHSVYRGSAFSSAIAGSSGSSYGGGGGGGAGGRMGASTYTGYGRTHSAAIDAHEAEESFGDSADEEDDDDEGTVRVEGEALYAIKWYKDNEEFYRYVPKANPQKTSYRFDGVRVMEEHSDSSRVLLRGLTLNSSGLYRCEISAEAPNFSSVQGEGRMDIVYLPRDGPHIKGQQFQYQIGETLNLNCTSGKSHPASHLQWFINEQPVLDGRYLVPYNDTVHKHGLITSTLGLQLTVDARHFHNGAMRVKCLASISPVLWKGGKESVLQRRPGIIDNREAMLLVRSSASSQHTHFLLQLHPLRNFLSGLRLLTIVAILTRICQLQLRMELT